MAYLFITNHYRKPAAMTSATTALRAYSGNKHMQNKKKHNNTTNAGQYTANLRSSRYRFPP
ncbi:exported hypothetical protein [Rhizobium mesoamericanum STM3625]|uniref:Uncharacterized protein n=1 Tax=Rhizobium mesoamericanum STM3625 TaxID=1211777 RepID=K0Q6E2_9HYPH|nr:exported hypothetical protein [Rhizobium mesoamericanum STM3625]